MDKNHLTDLADELAAEHGPYPQGRAQLQLWLTANLAMLSGDGIADPSDQRRWLHDRYPAWLRELAEQDLWLNLEDVGLEIVDFPDREQPPDQEREPLDVADVDFEPPKAYGWSEKVTTQKTHSSNHAGCRPVISQNRGFIRVFLVGTGLLGRQHDHPDSAVDLIRRITNGFTVPSVK